jgi:anaerobic ribonucleoside-triphosphate reductase activating protein
MSEVDTLRVAQIVPRTEAEGPGVRFAIWTQGCPLRCPGCCNPEMLTFKGGEEWAVDALLEKIRATDGVEGISLLGGEPTAQATPLARLAHSVRGLGLSVTVFSGFTLQELRASSQPGVDALLAATDLLIDGRFDRERPETRRRWIGSSNQTMHFLSPRYDPSDPAFIAPNTIEVRWAKGTLQVNGWPSAAASLLGKSR